MKITKYKLLPTQYNFLFGFDKSKLEEQEIYRDVSLYQGGFTCKKANAEWLSPNGWRRLDELTKDDLMAVYHRDGTIRFEHPKEVFKWKADKWYEFHTRTLHQINCPNHKMYTIKDGKEYIQSMTEFYEEHQESKNGHRGKFVTSFTQRGIKTGLTEDELRILVAYQADGTDVKWDSEYNARFHIYKERKVNRLVDLLSNYKTKIIKQSDGDTCIYVVIPEKLKVKVFPKEWYQLDSLELKIIVDECSYWDGSQGRHNSYYTSIKENADFIQFAGSASGYRTTIFTRIRPSASGSGKPVIEYRVNFNTNTMPSLYATRNKAEIKAYNAEKGEVKYCPSTSTGLWLCREFNQITVTGNSGKTFCGSLRGLLFALKWAGCSGLVGAATQDLLDGTTKQKYLEHMENIGFKEGVHWWYEDRKNTIKFINGSTIKFKTLSDWTQFRSTEFTWIEIEEASLIDEKTFKELMARIREAKKYTWEGYYRSMFLHTNPQGSRGWIYKFFHNKKTKKKNYRAVIAATEENYHLGTGYVADLKELYSADEIVELLEGIDNDNDNTIAFPYFNSRNIAEHIEFNKESPLILTCDFNYNPMCWYLQQFYNGKWYILKELIEQNVTTKQMCEIIQPVIDSYGVKMIRIMGDAHGRDKKTNGSDYSVMVSHFDAAGYDVELYIQKANPLIKDRLAVLRRYIRNGAGESKLIVDESCKWLLYNMEECRNQLSNGGLKAPTENEIKNDDKKRFLIHPIDSISYPMHYYSSYSDITGGESL